MSPNTGNDEQQRSQERLAKIVEQLKQVRLFQGLDSEHLQLLAEKSETEFFLDGQTIYVENTQATHVFIILKGIVRMQKKGRNYDMMDMELRTPGECLGLTSVFSGQPRMMTTTAVESCTLRVIPADTIKKVFQSKPDLISNIVSEAYKKLEELYLLIEVLWRGDATARVAFVLQRRAWAIKDARINDAQDGPIKIELSLADIGKLARVEESQASRSVTILVREGLVQRQGRKVLVVPNLSALTEWCYNALQTA